MAVNCETILLKNEYSYHNKLGQVIKVIKENGNTVFRSIDGEVIRDLRKKENDIKNLPIMDEKKILVMAKKIYNNDTFQSIINILGVSILVYFIMQFKILPITVFAENIAVAAVTEDLTVFKEVQQVEKFIQFIISLIKVLGISLSAFICANTGLKLLTDEDSSTMTEIKKTVNKLIWSLFFIFAGSSLASFIVRKLLVAVI